MKIVFRAAALEESREAIAWYLRVFAVAHQRRRPAHSRKR